MKLSDLENGAVVEVRNGERYLKVDNTFLNLNMKGNFMGVDDYNEELLCAINKNFDIMKVAMSKDASKYKNLSLHDARNEDWIWTRELEETILTKEEKEYLFIVIKPFKERVVYIKKFKGGDVYPETDWIRISVKSLQGNYCREFVDLPNFKRGSKYKNMKYNHEYTLKELELVYES